MQMNETRLKINVLKMLKKKFPTAFVYKAADKFTSGIPDILMCVRGQFIAIELKIPGNTPTKIQAYTILKIQAAGGLATYCTTVKEVEKFLHEYGVK